MINLKVLRLKDIFKLILILVVIILVFGLMHKGAKSDFLNKQVQQVSVETLAKCMEKALPLITTGEDIEKIEFKLSVKEILKFELGILDNVIENTDLEIKEEELTQDDIDELIEEKEDTSTEVLKTNVKESYNFEVDGVKISNKSKHEITEDMFNVDYNVNNKKDILIYHTHTCESYTATEENNYEQTGNFRTTDLNFTVARVGEELQKYLTEQEFNVTHDKTYHDYPAYSGSYDRSYETVAGILKENEEIDLIFDIHRDAIGSDSTYAPTVKINDEYVAQLMFVIGTNGGGLEHPNWKNNLRTAVAIQKKANELYPGLFKPIILRDSRYNQNLSTGASIIEVGATGNTLEQCLASMKYLSIVLSEVV